MYIYILFITFKYIHIFFRTYLWFEIHLTDFYIMITNIQSFESIFVIYMFHV